MNKRCKNAVIVCLTLIWLTASLQSATERIVLNEKEYFEGPGFFFLLYHNNYSGMQGGSR